MSRRRGATELEELCSDEATEANQRGCRTMPTMHELDAQQLVDQVFDCVSPGEQLSL